MGNVAAVFNRHAPKKTATGFPMAVFEEQDVGLPAMISR